MPCLTRLGLLTLVTVLGLLSIGLFFVPAMLAAVVAAFLPSRPRS